MGRRADKRSFTQPGRGSARSGNRQAPHASKASAARTAALAAVHEVRVREAFAQDVIDKLIDHARMSREDRAFATRLVLGVVSMSGVLDDVLNRCMHTPQDVTDDVRDALRISTYEIVFLNKSPHAAVDQGVELVRSIAPRAGGVANAVLRKVVAAKRSFPFGNPAADVDAYARLHGFPTWLARKLIDWLGAADAHAFMRASNEPAPLFIAVNAAKASDADVLAVVSEAHGEPEPVAVNGANVPGCYRLESSRAIADGRVTRLVGNGELLVSDATSQAVSQLVLAGDRPHSLLEIGSGRGTKTILLQSGAVRAWGSQIERYVTVDNHAFKSKLLAERAETYGVHVSETLTGNACDLDAVVGDELFDTVFVDAPCTGLGTLRRHPEIRWRIDEAALASYAELGAQLIAEAARHVAPGGVLVYATCTVAPEENRGVVEGFLATEEGGSFKVEPVCGEDGFFSVKLVPGGSDAHFAARLRRTG